MNLCSVYGEFVLYLYVNVDCKIIQNSKFFCCHCVWSVMIGLTIAWDVIRFEIEPLIVSVITNLSCTVLCTTVHISQEDLSDRTLIPQLLYLTHWAEMKCFVIIHLITESHNFRSWSRSNSSDSAPLISHCHKCLNTSRSLWAFNNQANQMSKGTKEKKWKSRTEGVKKSGNTKGSNL